MKEFPLTIATPDGVVFDGNAESILIKCEGGDVEILANHTDLFASLAIGRARIISGGKHRNASSAGGYISVAGGRVCVVATTFEFSDQIDVERAERAKKNAENAIKNAKNDKELTKAKLKLLRAISRIQVSNLK